MVLKEHFSLNDRYTVEEGKIILTGIQALVRIPIDQHKADQRAGLNTATLISGYRGSPLAGIDLTLQRSQQLLEEHHVKFIPAVNEDLGATSIFGSQLVNLLPKPKYDGVLGMWYGKAPGVDRTGDVFKHANITGVGRYGGVLAIAGDDPVAKSSTLPSHSEIALYDAYMPVLYPGDVQEVIDYGRLGFELSRYSGSWVGFKIVTNVADEYTTAEISPDRLRVIRPEFVFDGKPWLHSQNPNLLAPFSLNQEREIHEGRLEAAKLFAAENKLNKITVSTGDDWFGIVAAGKTYYDLREALNKLGLDEHTLQRCGIRLLKIGMVYPMEPRIVEQFAHGLEEILVIEEKRSFIELFIRDALYHIPDHPRVYGKKDEQGNFLVPGYSEIDADIIADILVQRLQEKIPDGILHPLYKPPILSLPMADMPTRTPYFCSGCPHNRSTIAPDGSLVGGGIGCHTLVILMEDRPTIGITQMGGEGAQWVGAAPFTEIDHIFQNIGDGTLFHSGSLAIRHARAAGVNITYKILYNSAVAMTGGQVADGELPVPDLTRALQAEGVEKIIVLSNEPEKYDSNANWAAGVEIWERDRLDEAQEILRDIPGVTILIYDQTCAAELRRKRRRGLIEDPAMRVVINEAICEGCGDCGEKSNCLSVFPVETEFGRKTQIHQSSCNKDYSCLEGDCPAFITVMPDEESIPPKAIELPNIQVDLPEPTRKVPETANIYTMGIGGTGVVTVNQILATAALIDGKFVRSLDQTGLSQKGGPVVSNLKIFDRATDASNMIAKGDADAYIVFDILSGTNDSNLAKANPEKTVAVVSRSKIPTGAMVSSTGVLFPEGHRLTNMIDSRTRAEDNVYLDAIALAESIFGDYMPANLLTIGAAYQAGLIPISAEAIEKAIDLNGVLAEVNKQAFRVGRMVVIDPEWSKSYEQPVRAGETTVNDPKPLSPTVEALIDEIGAEGELERLLRIRIPELIAYQNLDYARKYATFVREVKAIESELVPGNGKLSEAVARYLFKLMAYKDEYEVARLSLKQDIQQSLTQQFGQKAKIQYRLQPPLLRALGMQKKIALGKWFDHAYRLLVRMRRLRGTPFDIFGYAKVRRIERDLITQYENLIREALQNLTPQNYERAVKLAELPDIIRGYEDIKLRNVARFWEEVQKLGFDADETHNVETISLSRTSI